MNPAVSLAAAALTGANFASAFHDFLEDPPRGVELHYDGTEWAFSDFDPPLGPATAWPPVAHARIILRNGSMTDIVVGVGRFRDQYVLNESFLVPARRDREGMATHHGGRMPWWMLRVRPGEEVRLLAELDAGFHARDGLSAWMLCTRPREMRPVCSESFVPVVYVPTFYLDAWPGVPYVY